MGGLSNKTNYKNNPCSNRYSYSAVLLPKRDNCAQYYDCSHPGGQIEECPFPDLFNENTQQCEHYDQVDCGNKYEPTDACGYVGNKCTTKFCIPCNVRFPTCSGLRNGINAWRGRIWSPFYVECYNGRVVETKRCSNDFVFSPIELKCISLNQ
ncbi:uncharacterized protein LOC126828071 [Patella vulgata]|uniref:uncharacterized protein LOC126828071 n=1 Tax=Patella vulgata TaxID=6465 RepID=UPI0024A9D900|nr:uncharacterized protein LOC126828071 [Patella vulgata]